LMPHEHEHDDEHEPTGAAGELEAVAATG
jgi:hypothetical protein